MPDHLFAVAMLCAVVLAACCWTPRTRTRVPSQEGTVSCSRSRSRSRRRRGGGAGTVDVGVILTEVSGRLRAGADATTAWTRSLERAGLRAVADGAIWDDRSSTDLLDDLVAGAPRARHAVDLATAVVACRLSERLGAPLAGVLDSCATGLSEAARARDARRVALAGPRATARLLGWLPLGGLLLAVAMGGRPWAVLADGGWGSAAGIAGLALMIAGRRWTARLVTVAAGERTGARGRAAPGGGRHDGSAVPGPSFVRRDGAGRW